MSSRSKRFKFFSKMANMLGVALAIASLVTNLVPVGTASAHHATITGSVACESDGTKLVTWTITNSESSNHPMDITAISPTISGAGVGTVVPTSVQGTQSFAGTNHSTVSLSITGHWAFDNFSGGFSGSVNLGSNTCPTSTKVDVCHWTSSGHYNLVNVSVPSVDWWNDHGHGQHSNDIWASFTVNGTVVPAQGDQSILANGCVVPTPPADASVTPGSCSWTQAAGSLTDVTITLDNSSLVINGHTYTSTQTIQLPPGPYQYTWTANSGYTGSGSGDITIGDCTPPLATASVSAGTCSWSEAGGSQTPVTITLNGASLLINGVTYTGSTIINLGPGTYPYSWTAQSGYRGSGNGSIVIGDCTPGRASASVSASTCSWSEGTGSQTPVTITLTGASLLINGITYTSSTTINLGPGSYPYSWTAQTGFTGSGSGTLDIGDCTPGNGSASATISGSCSWTQAGGSVTPVDIALDHASLVINGQTYTTPQTINLGPGSYQYTWTADSGYLGSGSGDLKIGDCTPPDASASVVPGTCQWTAGAGSSTPVSYNLVGASLLITKDGSSDSYGPFISSGIVTLGPGSYSYSWTALDGYKGGGSGSFLVGDCTPGNASASIITGACSFSIDKGALTPVTISLDGAAFTINGSTYNASTNIDLAPGIYPYSWEPLTGFIGSGSGNLNVGNCNPADPLVKKADPLTYSSVGTIIHYTYEITNLGNVGLTGVQVTDDKAAVTCLKTTLAVNEIMTCTAAYSILQGDIDAGSVTNIATSLTDQTGPVHAQATVIAIIQTGLTIDKSVIESSYTLVGDLLHYHYLVTNTGNVTLTGVGVTDDKTAVICPKTTLAPSGSMTCSATYSVSDADMGSETITNTAFASGLYGTVPVVSAKDSTTVTRFLKLVLSSLCATNPDANDAWQVVNKNSYSFGFEYSLDGGAAGTGTAGGSKTITFETPISGRGTGVMSLYVGGIFQNNATAAKGCNNNPPSGLTPVPTPIPLIPGTGGPTVLIPVTGVDNGLLGRTLPGTLFGLSFGFFGLGLVLTGLARREED